MPVQSGNRGHAIRQLWWQSIICGRRAPGEHHARAIRQSWPCHQVIMVVIKQSWRQSCHHGGVGGGGTCESSSMA
eukprot:3543150-Prymnesium_polylepis.1